MSKAFTKDDGGDEPLFVPPRAPLPEGVANYMTPRGLALLRTELAELEAERSRLRRMPDEVGRRGELAATAERMSQLSSRISSAMVIDPAAQDDDRVRFGASARVRSSDGTERVYQIVGVDEADLAQGRVAFTAPLARSLIGQSAGDVAIVHTPRGDEELEILSVSYDGGGG